MWKRVLAVILAILGAIVAQPALAGPRPSAGPADLAPISAVVSCASLATTELSGVTGGPTTLAAAEVAGARPYCKVSGTISRAINFEVRLPLGNWTQRFLQTGCGGLCGMLGFHVENDEGCAPVTDGSIVLANDDMGHQGMGGAWGENADQRADFAYRANHVTALAAKTLIKAFYGQAPRYSYFSGCSDGGREALNEAQRYPQDFDGIAAGAPALNFTVQNSFHHAWLARSNTGPDGRAILTAIDMTPLHAAVLAQCDGLDGLVDGQITDPRACRFDPGKLACQGPYRPGECLTAQQVAAVRAIYDGARSPSGKRLEIQASLPGSEMEWIGVFVPREKDGMIASGGMALDTIDHLLFTPNPAYTIASFPFTEAMLASEEPARALYNADNPDLGAFAGHGGKLILYHGWADPHISPLNTIDYYERVGRAMGTGGRDGFVRMFLLPGMSHCGGGDGPSQFPLLAAMMAWVENGVAPDMVIAHRPAPRGNAMVPPKDGPPDSSHGGPPPEMLREMAAREAALAKLPSRSRPIYAYPQVARYSGTGSVNDAASFAAITPPPVNGISDWAGAQP